MSDNLEAPVGHQMYDFSDPRRPGPGVWFSMMVMAANAKDPDTRTVICEQIRLIIAFFKCLHCRDDAIKYVIEKPPEYSSSSAEELFTWVLDFMNTVNTKIGKPTYNKEIMYKQVTETGFMSCKKDCGNKSNETKSDVTVRTNSNIKYSRGKFLIAPTSDRN